MRRSIGLRLASPRTPIRSLSVTRSRTSPRESDTGPASTSTVPAMTEGRRQRERGKAAQEQTEWGRGLNAQ